MRRAAPLTRLFFGIGLLLALRPLQAQRPQWPADYGASAPPATAPSVSLGTGLQPFDPYASTPPAFPTPAPAPTPWASPAPSTPPWSTPMTPLPGTVTTPEPATVPPALPPTTPGSTAPAIIPQAPVTSPSYPAPLESRPLFDRDPFSGSAGPPYQRLFEDTGFRYTFLWGEEDDQDLEIHEVELSTTMVFPGRLPSSRGFRLTPGFAFLFLDGPFVPTTEMPDRLYSAYLDSWWNPQITPQLSAELSVRVGVFSDFNTFTIHSLRTIGAGVAVVRLTPSWSAKLGAVYLDRNRVKILPAAGFTYEPDQHTRWDIFFPAPKLAKYWKNVRNTEVWWYVGGEYGGGAWTFERQEGGLAGQSERVDINDIRVFLGLELFSLNRWYGFVEGGYVFDRELYFVEERSQSLSLDDTFMLRAGMSF